MFSRDVLAALLAKGKAAQVAQLPGHAGAARIAVSWLGLSCGQGGCGAQPGPKSAVHPVQPRPAWVRSGYRVIPNSLMHHGLLVRTNAPLLPQLS